LAGGIKLLNRPLKALLLGVLLSHLATYMVLPLLPIYLKASKGVGVAEIGMILAVSPFAFQAGSLLGGWLSDRYGRRMVIVLGAWINAAALTGYAWFHAVPLLVATALLSGLGVGLNAPSTKASIAALASEGKHRTTAFSLRGISANLGIVLGGVITYFILGGASEVIFYAASGIYALLGVICRLFLPKGCGDEPCESVPIRSYLEVFRNKGLLVFSILSVPVWALYTQLSLSLPLRAEAVLPDPGVVSLIWTLNSIVVVVLQAPVSRLLLRRMQPMIAISLGVLFLGVGLGSLYWAVNLTGFILSGLVFIMGEMLIIPTVDSTVSRLGSAKMVGILFGISNFVSGLGESSGKLAGGQLLSLGTMSAAPWLSYMIIAVVISGILAVSSFMTPLRGLSSTSTAQEVGNMPPKLLLPWRKKAR
jgi:predicted MFS family arabinose efflux permease